MREVARSFLGRRVLIRGDHPHAGEAGTVGRVEMARAIRRWGFVVDLDDGGGCFVFSGTHWQVIE